MSDVGVAVGIGEMPLPHPTASAEALAAMYAHARRDYPNECCGIVFGPKGTPGADRAVACVNTQNDLHAQDPVTHARDARTAYNLGAGDLFKLGKSLRGDTRPRSSITRTSTSAPTSATPTRPPP